MSMDHTSDGAARSGRPTPLGPSLPGEVLAWTQMKHSAMSRVDAPREEWILAAEIPPIVSQEQSDHVQARLASNRRFAQRNNKAHPYLLRGLVSCVRRHAKPLRALPHTDCYRRWPSHCLTRNAPECWPGRLADISQHLTHVARQIFGLIGENSLQNINLGLH